MQKIKTPLALLCLLFLLCLALAGCKGKDTSTIPIDFEWEEDALPALGSVSEEYADAKVETTFPDEDKEPELDEEGNEIASVDPIVYSYSGLEDSGQAVSDYVDLLTSSEYSFGVVNSLGQMIDPPDFTAEKGLLVLSRGNLHTKKMLRFTIEWEPNECTVSVYRVDALPARTDPNEPIREISPTGEVITVENPNKPSSGGKAADDIVTTFENMTPAELGLPGESMDEYNVYYVDGQVLVNDEPCSRVRIYVTGYPEETNVFMGTFLMGSSSGRIYQHDTDTDEMTEIRR